MYTRKRREGLGSGFLVPNAAREGDNVHTQRVGDTRVDYKRQDRMATHHTYELSR